MSEENKGLTCPITGCPLKNILMATVGVLVTTYAFNWVSDKMLEADYAATAAVWRPDAEMAAMFNIDLIYNVVLAFAVAALYCLMGKNSPCGGACSKTGIKFGLLLGLIMGISDFSIYTWLPITMTLAVKWLAGGIIWGVLTGFVLSKVCGTCCKKA